MNFFRRYLFRRWKQTSQFSELESKLSDARDRRALASKTATIQVKGDCAVPDKGWEEYWAAAAEVLVAERNLAAAKGEPYAVPVAFPVRWKVGAPLPYLLQNDYRTFLMFLLEDADPEWDGRVVRVVEPSDEAPRNLALVEFKRCVCAKFGAPNDEVFAGHDLSGKGLEPYTAQRVMNSKWIAELEAINSIHHCYSHDRWTNLNHYVFWFHDSTFECVAESFVIETKRTSVAKELDEVCRRLLN